MVIVFDMTTGEVEYQDGGPAAEREADGAISCPGVEAVPRMEPQLGLQEVTATPAADYEPALVAALLRNLEG